MVDEAKKLVKESGLRVIACDDLDQAAQLAVQVAEIVKRAKEARLEVKFELPI